MLNTASNNKRIAKNTLLLYFRQMLILLVSLYTSRVVLKSLGINDFGIFNVVGGIVSLFSFIMGTMSSASQRYLAYDLARGDKVKLKETFSLILLTYVLLAIITIFLTESIGVWFLNTYMNLPKDRIFASNWVFQFAILSFLVNIFSGPYLSVVIAHEQMNVYAYVSIIDALLKLLIAYLIQVSPFDKLVFYALMLFLTSTISTLCYLVFCYNNYHESHFCFFYDKKRLLDMTAFAWWNMIGALAMVIRSQGINVLINIFFSPAINAARGIAYQVNNAVYSFANNFQTAVKPQITKNYSIGNLSAMHSLIFKSARLSFLLIYVFSFPILFYTEHILDLWLDKIPPYTPIFIRILLITLLFEVLATPFLSGLQAANKIKMNQLSVSLIYMLNLPISYFFLKRGCTPEIPMYINLVLVLVTFIPRLLLCRYYLEIPLFLFAKEVLAKVIFVLLFSLFGGYFLKCLINQSVCSYASLIGLLVTFLIACILSFFMGCKKSERRAIIQYLNKIKK